MTAAMVPVADVLRANPAWVRDDLGDIKALAKDVALRGVLVPIAAARDCLVYDGARRVMAAKQAKVDLIPVVWCDDWLTAVAAMRAAVSQPDAYPMTWAELNFLWTQRLKPLSDEHRYSNMGAARRRNRRQQLAQPELEDINLTAASSPYSKHTAELAAIYGTVPASVKVMRDGWTQLERMRKTAPEFFNAMITAINQLMQDPANREIDRARQIKYAVRRHVEALPDADVKENVDMFMAMASKPQTLSRKHADQYRSRTSRVQRTEPVTTLTVLNNFAVLLDQVAATADGFVNFEEDRQTVAVITARILASIRHIQAMRRRLENSVLTDEEEEENASR